MSIAFFFCFVDADYNLALRLVKQLKNYYPESLILAVGDGTYKEIEGCTLHCGIHLKKHDSIGKFIHRNFRFIATTLKGYGNVEFVIKLDPDSFLVKPFSAIPVNQWLGEVNQGRCSWGYSKWARGGGYAMSIRSVNLIANSGLAMHPRYAARQSFEDRRVYEDCRVGHIANSLGIFPVEWADVSCGRISPSDPRCKTKSLIHPVKSATTLQLP